MNDGTIPTAVNVAGVELSYASGCYQGQLGVFVARIDDGREGGWCWHLDEEFTMESRGRASVRGMGTWDTPREAAANMTRVVGLFASLPRGASA